MNKIEKLEIDVILECHTLKLNLYRHAGKIVCDGDEDVLDG